VPVALRDFGLVSLRRAAVVWAACGITVTIGIWLVLKARYYGLPLAVLPLAVGVPAWLATTRRTGLALAVVLLYLGLFDGVVKLKAGGQAATLGRDVVLYAVAIGMAARARGPFRMPALRGWVVAWTVVVIVQLANPGNSSMSHAVASLRQDLEFIPLFFIGFVALRTHASLHAFFALLLAVAAINGPVAAYQSSLTPHQLSAWGPGYSALINSQGDARVFKGSDGKLQVRPMGLGADMGFGGILGATALPGGIALLITYRRRPWLLGLVVLGMIGAGIGVLTSQSRSSVVTAIVAVVATLGLLAVGRQGKGALVALGLVVAVAAAAVNAIGSYDPGTFYRYKSIAPSSAASTIYSSRVGTWATIPQYMREIPFGAGLGKVGPAAKKAGGMATDWNAESQFNFLIVETGIPGLLVFLSFQAALCSTVLRALRRERDPHTVVLMAGLAAPLFGFAVNWFIGVNTTSTPNAPYLWLAAGVISWWLVTRQRAAAASGSHG
jgi:hypothetical protein